jgi:hypothetical protein
MKTVDAEVAKLDRAIASSQTDDSYKANWVGFMKEWTAFYADNSSGVGAWWARGTTPVYDKVIEFRNRAVDWRKSFEDWQGKALPGASLEKADSGTSWKTWALLGGGVLAAVAAAYYFGRQKG